MSYCPQQDTLGSETCVWVRPPDAKCKAEWSKSSMDAAHRAPASPHPHKLHHCVF